MLICILIYCLILFIISLIFSINLSINIFSLISSNFECGFYSIIISSLRYRFNYWLILFHYILFEQELILSLLIIYGIHTLTSNLIIIFLLIFLFIDLFIYIIMIIREMKI